MHNNTPLGPYIPFQFENDTTSVSVKKLLFFIQDSVRGPQIRPRNVLQA